ALEARRFEAPQLEPTVRRSFSPPTLPAAKQLLLALLCLITAGELTVEDVATQLNAAVATAFAGRPNLWCFSSDDDEAGQAAWLAGILEVERQGVAATVAAWQALRLPTAASAAVAALRSLASPIQDGARHLGLEVNEDTVLQALQAYRNGWLQPQEGAFDTMQRPEAPKLRAELFQ
ncbi:unnamed protein product, partial [Polarella glacialis]